MTVAEVFFFTFFYLISHHIFLVIGIAYDGGYEYWLLSIRCSRIACRLDLSVVENKYYTTATLRFFLPHEAISVVYVDPALHSFSNYTVPNGVQLFTSHNSVQFA